MIQLSMVWKDPSLHIPLCSFHVHSHPVINSFTIINLLIDILVKLFVAN
jgi:hypothetical protein